MKRQNNDPHSGDQDNERFDEDDLDEDWDSDDDLTAALRKARVMSAPQRRPGESFAAAFEAVMGVFAGLGCVVLCLCLLGVLLFVAVWKGDEWYTGRKEARRARHVASLLLPTKAKAAALKESEMKDKINAFITTACYGGISTEAIRSAVKNYRWAWPGPCPRLSYETRERHTKVCDILCRAKLQLEEFASSDSEEYRACFYPCLEADLRTRGVLPAQSQ